MWKKSFSSMILFLCPCVCLDSETQNNSRTGSRNQVLVSKMFAFSKQRLFLTNRFIYFVSFCESKRSEQDLHRKILQFFPIPTNYFLATKITFIEFLRIFTESCKIRIEDSASGFIDSQHATTNYKFACLIVFK